MPLSKTIMVQKVLQLHIAVNLRHQKENRPQTRWYEKIFTVYKEGHAVLKITSSVCFETVMLRKAGQLQHAHSKKFKQTNKFTVRNIFYCNLKITNCKTQTYRLGLLVSNHVIHITWGLSTCKTGLSPQLVYNWPFQGGAQYDLVHH